MGIINMNNLQILNKNVFNIKLAMYCIWINNPAEWVIILKHKAKYPSEVYKFDNDFFGQNKSLWKRNCLLNFTK